MKSGVYRLGGVCSILLGIVSLLVGLTYLLLPAEQRLGVGAAQLLPSFAQNPTLLDLQSIELSLAGVLGLAVVPAVFGLMSDADDGWLRWVTNLAYLGFGVAAFSNLLSVGRMPGIANAFVNGDASTKAALIPVWRSTLDWFGIWQFGAVAVWVLVIGLLARRGNILPAILCYVGIAYAILQLLVPAAFIFKLPALIIIVSAVGFILGPIWYIWLGLALRYRTAAPAKQAM